MADRTKKDALNIKDFLEDKGGDVKKQVKSKED
eukprot:CAMPEP_0170562474 /NCGR_PEP_ID=MMETSP0211-20121228/60735_1 /TAXON_ID=311385 /ORGANISM="Pseudokeronopsis sp., Strain OXSARD2" /LENGTH=32 /DNA_ID= /DNA_START= /DNA_END= /DNA_ORIENTATION=